MAFRESEPLEPPDRYIPVPPSFDPNDVYWKTKEGEVMAIVDMDDSHMENCMRMMLRQAEHLHEKECYRMARIGDDPVLGPHGDWANDSFDRMFDEMMDMKPTEWLRRHYPPFVAMHNELRARKQQDYADRFIETPLEDPVKSHDDCMEEVYNDITERDHQFGHGPF